VTAGLGEGTPELPTWVALRSPACWAGRHRTRSRSTSRTTTRTPTCSGPWRIT